MTRPPRVVSLLASGTEIVHALGLGDRLVGRSHECDWPPDVLRLPACSAPRFDPRVPSAVIDDRVRALVARALSIYEVDVDLLERLRPDVIITQDQCEVCAVSLKDVEAAVCRLVGSRPRIVSLSPHCLVDVWDDVGRVAAALDVPERGEALVASLWGRMAAIEARATVLGLRPRVACVEWIEPLMAAGNWMPELVAMAGGESLFGVAGRHSPWMTWEALVAADPDVLLVSPCGFTLEQTAAEMPLLMAHTEWRALAAVRAGQVVLADGNAYFHRSGPRLVESLEILAEILHPGEFAFGHAGRGWMRWRTRIADGMDGHVLTETGPQGQ